jgi:hypothetical protein
MTRLSKNADRERIIEKPDSSSGRIASTVVDSPKRKK